MNADRFDKWCSRHQELESEMARIAVGSPDYVLLAREYARLSPLAQSVTKMRRLQRELSEAEDILAQSDQDKELYDLAHSEKRKLEQDIAQLRDSLDRHDRDSDDDRDVILEIRAGTGGEEAALFAADLMRMYQRYAERKGWTFEIVEHSENPIGGLREMVVNIAGKDVFSRLRYESGTHRVQRVPVTESGGRIHTSAATVAVLPQADPIDVTIDPSDLRVDVFRASGPGGQSVNTTDSAVRVTHIPSGIIAQCQDEKSQHRNKAKALNVLMARLYEKQRRESEEKRARDRRSQIGSGDRSQRIRTYNFPQNRVSDHRINLTLHKLAAVLDGESLDTVIDLLSQARRLEESA